MAGDVSRTFNDVAALVREIITRTGGDIRLALPLGLGKANTIVNALTEAAIADSAITLSIITAATLEAPRASGGLQKRFLEPAAERLFGNYPPLIYAQKLHDGSLPENIQVSEFFVLAARWLGNRRMQRNYISANYTHALEYTLAFKPNVICQLVARDGDRFSYGCNADIAPDLIKARAEGKASFIAVGEVNSGLPFMDGTGEMPTGEIDLLLDDPATDFDLFSVAKRPVSLEDYAIGLYASLLVPDGGTLQIGIGSIGDALAQALLLRHGQNGVFQSIVDGSPFARPSLTPEVEPFVTGLYAATEMLVDGLLQLLKAGVIKREGQGAFIHAGFFMGTRAFRQMLKDLPETQRDKIAMMPVSFINALYGDEAAKRLARRDMRFVNNAMMATLLGAVVSDGLESGQVISGVGGQFNFVEQAFVLEGARSILTVNATRTSKGKTTSNIVWSYGHQTVPRHYKDIIISEYGIADLRGKTDEETVKAMLAIADSRFQPGLLEQAKSAGKIATDYEIPADQQRNLPENLASWLRPAVRSGDLPVFPFGTDFTKVEQRLLPALALLKQSSKADLARLAWQGMGAAGRHHECLQRMLLDQPRSIGDRIMAAVLAGALEQTVDTE